MKMKRKEEGKELLFFWKTFMYIKKYQKSAYIGEINTFL